jgi:hypothetical protein
MDLTPRGARSSGDFDFTEGVVVFATQERRVDLTSNERVQLVFRQADWLL